MTARLNQKLKNLGGITIGHPVAGSLTCVSIGFDFGRAAQIVSKRRRAREKRLWRKEAAHAE